MVRRLLLTVVLIAAAAASGWAAANATFVLTNGQRQSGTLIYGRGENNIVDLQFHVSVSGSDVAIPIHDVAAIDFTGTNPPQAELDSLPADSNAGVMVMRNGTKVNGHLHNIIGNDQVQWVNQSGQRQNYPISDVSRLYLNPPAARTAYAGSAPTAAGTAGTPTSGQSVTVHVPANRAWTPAGINVQRGQVLQFSSSGQVQLSTDASDSASVDGRAGSPASAKASLPGTLRGALLGRVGNGRPFGIGGQTSITAPASGPLYLGVNDDGFSDNTGEFVVTITGGATAPVGVRRK